MLPIPPIPPIAPLTHDDIIVVADEFWDDPHRVRHKMPLAWARAGNRVLWIEKPPNPRMDWGVKGRLRDAVTGRLRQADENLWIGSAPPAPPRLEGGGALGEALAAAYCPFLAGRIRHYVARISRSAMAEPTPPVARISRSACDGSRLPTRTWRSAPLGRSATGGEAPTRTWRSAPLEMCEPHETGDFRPSLIVLFQQAPLWRLVTHFPGVRSVYYCNDLFGYGQARAGAEAVERRCCAVVDLVFATSDHLRRRLAAHHPHVVHVPHAVDPEWWDANCGRTPAEYATIPRPRAVFTGVVGAVFDLDLVAEVARLRPEVQWVLAGPLQTVHLDAAALERLKRLPNLHLLGSRPVEDLPGFIAGADALVLPYHCNAVMREAGLPLKFYEYCIGGSPILATPFTDFETEARDLIALGRDAAQWAAMLDEALREPSEHPDRAARRRALARANTYADRLAQQRTALSELANG